MDTGRIFLQNITNMTLIVSWVALDGKKERLEPSSIYIASDSRISWSNNHFDYGQKVLGCKNYPDIFGYCGDVLFPLMILSQIIEVIDSGLLYEKAITNEEKFNIILQQLTDSIRKYPVDFQNIISNSIDIIHASRDVKGKFECCVYKWSKKDNVWEMEILPMPEQSGLLYASGSGGNEFKSNFVRFQKGDSAGTSRNIFQCLCDTLNNIKDKFCGGSPQLIGLYRKNNSVSLGVIYNNRRFLNGYEVSNIGALNSIGWRNQLFEICDGETMRIKDNSQRQPNPLMK